MNAVLEVTSALSASDVVLVGIPERTGIASEPRMAFWEVTVSSGLLREVVDGTSMFPVPEDSVMAGDMVTRAVVRVRGVDEGLEDFCAGLTEVGRPLPALLGPSWGVAVVWKW